MAAILADRARPTTQHNIVLCYVCGHTFVYKGRRGDPNGRFCSMRCQDWYDAGNAPITDRRIVYRYRDGRSMKSISKGFYIACAHCREEFESLACDAVRPNAKMRTPNASAISRSWPKPALSPKSSVSASRARGGFLA